MILANKQVGQEIPPAGVLMEFISVEC
jgi:hypothetical protein